MAPSTSVTHQHRRHGARYNQCTADARCSSQDCSSHHKHGAPPLFTPQGTFVFREQFLFLVFPRDRLKLAPRDRLLAIAIVVEGPFATLERVLKHTCDRAQESFDADGQRSSIRVVILNRYFTPTAVSDQRHSQHQQHTLESRPFRCRSAYHPGNRTRDNS